MGFSLKVEAWVSNHQRRGIVSNCASWEEQLRGFGVCGLGLWGNMMHSAEAAVGPL